MLHSIIPDNLYRLVEDFYINQTLNEIRLRNGFPIVINIKGVNHFLGRNGLVTNSSHSILADIQSIESIVYKATRQSLYAFNNQIKQGFITYYGIRIGIAGEVVEESGIIKTIKNIASLNIRIPNKIKTLAHKVYSQLYKDKLHSTLIISPPGAGKSSFLRDLALLFSQDSRMFNVSLIDERGELSLNNLSGVDTYTNCRKELGFINAIRSMRPDIIITDEIGTSGDYLTIEKASTCGVCVIASMHANDISDLKSKKDFGYILTRKLFTRYIVLSNKQGPGTIEGIFDEGLEKRL